MPVVRELVRVNHHRNCLLCHAPGNTGNVSPDTLTAEVPVPGQPLTPPSSGYDSTQQEILVRLDVTYLRQDFSALQPVADANPWPEMQRFDFLVRTRTLTDEEAAAYRTKLAPRETGEFSPYQRAALAALRRPDRPRHRANAPGMAATAQIAGGAAAGNEDAMSRQPRGNV